MTMIGAATTLDRWESDLADLLGLDAVDASRDLAPKRRRTRLMILGAAALAGSVSVGFAIQHQPGSPAGNGGLAARGSADRSAGAELVGGSPTVPPRSDVERRDEPPPVERPVPGLAAAAPDDGKASFADEAGAGQVSTPPPTKAGRNRASDRPAQARPAGRLAAIIAGLSETASGGAPAGRSLDRGDDRAAERSRRDPSEVTSPRSELVVPLRLLLPSPAGNARRGAPTLDDTQLTSGERPRRRAGSSNPEGKTEALDALRSLRRQ